jgi:hypothetical protein
MTIRSVCCVCGIQYGTKPDGLAEVRESHGFCQKHYDEAMANIESQFAELPADLAREVAA